MKILINEWQEHLLKDYIIYEDDRIVCEEKGISEEVRIAAYSTLDKIKSQILSNVDKFVDISKYKTKLYNGSFKVNEFSKDININYSCYFFEDKDLGQEFFNQNIDKFDSGYFIDNNGVPTIEISFYSFDLKKDYGISMLIHEFLHLYQDLLDKNLFSDEKKYKMALKYVNSNQPIMDWIATTIYMSEYSEQDAYIHATYAIIKPLVKSYPFRTEDSFKKQIDEHIVNTELWLYFKKLLAFKEYLKDKQVPNFEISFFGFQTQNQIKSLLLKTISRLTEKINRLKKKIVQDKLFEEGVTKRVFYIY